MMSHQMNYNTYDFSNSQHLLVCGDIHGNFDMLVEMLCVLNEMTNTTCIVAGDCGFGFKSRKYYEEMLLRNSPRMEEADNRIVFVRGNHDNPAYFDGEIISTPHFIAVPDYSVIKAAGHTVLCIGGAVSTDRKRRIDAWNQEVEIRKIWGYTIDEENIFSPKYYWPDEQPVFNDELLSRIIAENKIDIVVTHTAPSFCEKKEKDELQEWAKEDNELLTDVQHERAVMDAIHEKLKDQDVLYWCYGHFHWTWCDILVKTIYKMLGIMELHEVY